MAKQEEILTIENSLAILHGSDMWWNVILGNFSGNNKYA